MIAPPSPAALTLPLRTPRPAARAPLVSPESDILPRFTVDGSRDLERHLAQTCAKIGAGVRGLVSQGRLEALLLGGGYGRGEGGVLHTSRGDRPYNDLEFYVCLRGNRHLNELRFGHALHVLGEILTPQAGIEVEFKITSISELEQMGVSMFSYDLLSGHRLIVGDASRLTHCHHHRDAEAIPLAEATRLLMNRCSGLLFAKEKLEKREFTGADADFVRRNIAKAQLALGDAVLVAHGHYHWSARERHRQVERLARENREAWYGEVAAHHAAGVRFKLEPERSTATRDELLSAHGPVTALAERVFLWLESRRLGHAFATSRDYALSTLDKLPELRSTRNLLVNAKVGGLASLLTAEPTRHPRSRILHALSLLLWDPETFSQAKLRRRLQSELRTDADSFNGTLPAYRQLWARLN